MNETGRGRSVAGSAITFRAIAMRTAGRTQGLNHRIAFLFHSALSANPIRNSELNGNQGIDRGY